MAQPPRPHWHLSFDCATKTFAFSLSRVDLDDIGARLADFRRRAAALTEICRRGGAGAVDIATLRAAAAAADALCAEVRGLVVIADGEMVDLAPGRSDNDVPGVERIRAVVAYVKARVRPALSAIVPSGERLRIAVEFQLGFNSKSRVVAAALVTLFAEEDVIIVGPALKNQIATCEEGRYWRFAEKYSKSYDANKAHSKFNFSKFEAVFGSSIPPCSPAMRGHIADSFMQVIGYLVHGPDEETVADYF